MFGCVALLWIRQGLRAARGMSRLPWLDDASLEAAPTCPSVSVIFAARNEAATLPAALRTKLELDFPDYEVVAVNDRSQDATPAILNQFARTSKRLRVVHVNELPAGWLGKPHALEAGYRASRGEWLVFTDADVHFAPTVLRHALALAEQRGWDHLSLIGGVEMRGFWEKTAITYFGLGFVVSGEPWEVDNARSGRYAGVGAFQMLRRSTYEAIGMHRRLALEVIDDMKLGKLVKLGGFRSGVGFTRDLMHVRWQDGLGNMVRGLTKNLFAGCGYRVSMTLGAIALALVMSVAPFLGLAFASGWARALAGVAVAAILGVHAAVIWKTPASPLYALTHPLGALIFCYTMARSAAITLWHGGVVWRDTFYPLAELKRGLV